jgi:subtilisin family serine protease
MLPAEAGNGMAVSATGPIGQENFDNPASYTNYGTSVIDVAAPGGDFQLYPEDNWWLDMVISTLPGGWAWMAGTSMATPHVSGVAALVIGQHGGEMQPAQVKAIIEQSADDLGKPGMDDYYGCGRINAYKAVAGIKKAPAISRGRVSPSGKLTSTWGKLKASR